MNISILIFLGIAFILVFTLRLAKIGTLLAFLSAGIIAGPQVLGLWQVSETWTVLGQIGIMFLWFMMGLELNFKRLWQLRYSIFGFGAAQVLMVAVMLFPILFGLTAWTMLGTIMIAMMLAMSSTSSDLQTLADRNELQTGMGRQTFSILLFQDLLAIPLLAMLPVFAGRSVNFGAEVVDVAVMTCGLILGVVIIGRLLLNPLMKLVLRLKSKEAFLLAIVLNIVGCAVMFDFIGLPPSMGAFIAGMLLSETIYRQHIQVEIQPYQIMFLSFFFIALGMGLDLSLLANHWWIVAAGVAALIIIKFCAVYIVARVRNIHSREAFLIALILAQGGEFGLLILQTMKKNGIEAIPATHGEILTAIIIISMMLTPILLAIYDKLYAAGKFQHGAGKISKPVAEKPEVIICGFGRVGQTIARMLAAEKISYAAVDMNIDAVIFGREGKYNVFYGDTTNEHALKNVGMAVRHTRAVVVALDNAAVAKKAVRAIRRVLPRVPIFARARNLQEAGILTAEGVKIALPETIESSFMLGQKVLESIGVKERTILHLLASMRGHDYAVLEEAIGKRG